MNKVIKLFTISLLFIFIYIIFKYNYILNKSVIDAVNLWITKVVPSLFIMFILNDIIINTNLLNFILKPFYPLFNKTFVTNGASFQAFALSLFSGSPSSAFIIKEMLNNHFIDIDSANKLICFTYFSNPLFLYNILLTTFNTTITLKIIVIHYISNIIIGFINRKRTITKNIKINIEDNAPRNIIMIIPSSIKKSLNTLFMILGTITFYMIITNFLVHIFKMPLIFEIIIKGVFEITQSLNVLNDLNCLSIIKETIAISIISFGGLSIHSQVASLLFDTKISYINFFKSRVLHVFISITIYLIFYLIFPYIY